MSFGASEVVCSLISMLRLRMHNPLFIYFYSAMKRKITKQIVDFFQQRRNPPPPLDEILATALAQILVSRVIHALPLVWGRYARAK